jgi:hypothetical protein
MGCCVSSPYLSLCETSSPPLSPTRYGVTAHKEERSKFTTNGVSAAPAAVPQSGNLIRILSAGRTIIMVIYRIDRSVIDAY